jgi:hypothetical protein
MGRRGQRHEGPAIGGVDGGEEAGPAARGEELPVGALFWWYGEDVSYAPHQDIAALGVVTLALSAAAISQGFMGSAVSRIGRASEDELC